MTYTVHLTFDVQMRLMKLISSYSSAHNLLIYDVDEWAKRHIKNTYNGSVDFRNSMIEFNTDKERNWFLMNI